MKTSLCYITRIAQCDLRINLQTGLFGDDITTVSLNTSKGLYIGGTSAKDTKSLSKVISRYMKKNSENVQRIIVVDGQGVETDVTSSIHTPVYEVKKLIARAKSK